MQSQCPVVGLTGGIGSGKSSAATMFAELGVPVVDADAIAREIVKPGTEGYREVVDAFGPGIVLPSGELDRPQVAALVFSDGAARAKLNAIAHPKIAALSVDRLRQAASSRVPYVLYEASLLVENRVHEGAAHAGFALAALIVVAAPTELQVERVQRRDGMDAEAVRARIASQLPLEDKIRAADFVIWNDGDLDHLQAEVMRTHDSLCRRFAHADPSPG